MMIQFWLTSSSLAEPDRQMIVSFKSSMLASAMASEAAQGA
jgi:hypothetical protein